jgi:2-haloacid dehalogenase
LFAGTAKHLKVEFDWLITAEQVRSYKPSTRNFEFAIETMGIAPEKLLHVAQSVYHDIVPAKALGISTVWVNRRHDKTGFGATMPASSQPDLEVPDLKTLVEIIG